jgi:hypothetical protein
MNEYECYQMYTAIRLHFEGSFDYFKYGTRGQIRNQSHATYNKRTDKHIFRKVAKAYPHSEVENLIVSNFVYGRCSWVGELSEDVYFRWKKVNESLSYTFEQDCKFLMQREPSFLKLIDCKDGTHPMLLDIVNSGRIQFETFIILNSITSFTVKGKKYKFFDIWDKLLNDIVWTEIRNTAVRYEPFIKYDKYRMKGIFRKIVLGET